MSQPYDCKILTTHMMITLNRSKTENGVTRQYSARKPGRFRNTEMIWSSYYDGIDILIFLVSWESKWFDSLLPDYWVYDILSVTQLYQFDSNSIVQKDQIDPVSNHLYYSEMDQKNFSDHWKVDWNDVEACDDHFYYRFCSGSGKRLSINLLTQDTSFDQDIILSN